MSRSKSSVGLFVLGIVLFAWSASQFSISLQKTFGPHLGDEEQVVEEPLPEDLATLQAEIERGIEPETPTPEPTLADPTEAARQTTIAANLAAENTFLDLSAESAATPRPTSVKFKQPDRILIPAIGLDAPVKKAKLQLVEILEKKYPQWSAPNEFAAGWHTNTAGLGQKGNLVLNGHHNVYGEVFGKLADIQPGDEIILFSGSDFLTYQVTNRMILPEKYQPLEVRLQNAQWLEPTQDERLTLVTCWPHDNNTHRLVVVAKPAVDENLDR